MEALFTFLESHPYMTYSGAVVLFTAGVRNSFFKNSKLAPKWITFIVGVVLAIMEFFMGWIDLSTPTEFFLLVASLGAASAFYDYIIKFFMDIIRKRNPFRE